MPPNPIRVLIHPGFHKTGTSALQHCLRLNRENLKPHFRTLLLPSIKASIDHCRAFAIDQDPKHLTALKAQFLQDLETYTGARPLVLSCEGLCGRTPGQADVADYSAAIPLLHIIKSALVEKFGEQLHLEFLFTLRQPEPWLQSAWKHNLMGGTLTLDWPEFRETYKTAAALNSVVDQVETEMPNTPCHRIWLEDYSTNPMGTAAAIFEHFNLDQTLIDSLIPPRDLNTGPSTDLTPQLLELNKSGLSQHALRGLKRELVEKS